MKILQSSVVIALLLGTITVDALQTEATKHHKKGHSLQKDMSSKLFEINVEESAGKDQQVVQSESEVNLQESETLFASLNSDLT